MNHVVILAGGVGTRLGGEVPKQYIEIEGRPIISRCMDVLFSNCDVDTVRIVADNMWHEYLEEHIRLDVKRYGYKWKGFCTPGENRQLSIWNALGVLVNEYGSDDLVMFHDAARPNIKSEFISECFNAVGDHDGVMPILPVKDTMYLCNEKKIEGLLQRSKIFAGQAPEVFKLGKYYEANKALLPDVIRKINGSTEPAIMAGMDIVTIEGDEDNFKITTVVDLEKFKNLCAQN